MRKISLEQVAKTLCDHNNIELLTHSYPDGDTMGSAFALCMALQSMGKNARVLNSGILPPNFLKFGDKIIVQDFKPEYTVSIDVAAPSLLGKLEEEYKDKIDLCIDHHGSNSVVADNMYVDPSAAAVGEIIFELIKLMSVPITKEIAEALYLAISTDTGCFRYGNTTSRTMRVCAELLDCGVDNENINYVIFEQKNRKKIMLERMVYDTLMFFCDGKGAMITITLDMLRQLDMDDSETEGLASIPRQIEGVMMGITLREKSDGVFKISVRTNSKVNACDFCSRFGGGGHHAAAGCSLAGSKEEVQEKLVMTAEEFL